ncbi:MAG: DUF4869 domain-containing protein [Eubacterium sp.]|nr:DUF4869 domain-containing protein [Eubacterium sp.]
MLNIQFGEMERVAYGPTYFKYNYELEWLQDPFVQKMIEDVDKSRYVEGGVIDSEVLGPIPPERLSGGVQTLIMIYELPGKVFDATSCGPNCARWLLEIGKKKDITEIHIVNAGRCVHDMEDYTISANQESF